MDTQNTSRITYEGQDWDRPIVPSQSQPPKMIRWIMKNSMGIIRDEKQANYVILGIAVVLFVISIFLFKGGHSSVQKATPEQMRQIRQMPVLQR